MKEIKVEDKVLEDVGSAIESNLPKDYGFVLILYREDEEFRCSTGMSTESDHNIVLEILEDYIRAEKN